MKEHLDVRIIDWVAIAITPLSFKTCSTPLYCSHVRHFHAFRDRWHDFGLGGAFVSRIEGDYHTVVGFPASRFCSELDAQRLSAWVAAAARAEAPAPVSSAATEEEPIVSDECLDEDECGLPSD